MSILINYWWFCRILGWASFSDFTSGSREKADEVKVQRIIVHIFLFTPVGLCEEISYSVALLKSKIFHTAFKWHLLTRWKDKYNMMSFVKQQCFYTQKLKNYPKWGVRGISKNVCSANWHFSSIKKKKNRLLVKTDCGQYGTSDDPRTSWEQRTDLR